MKGEGLPCLVRRPHIDALVRDEFVVAADLAGPISG